jgi:hypothetical protein
MGGIYCLCHQADTKALFGRSLPARLDSLPFVKRIFPQPVEPRVPSQQLGTEWRIVRVSDNIFFGI